MQDPRLLALLVVLVGAIIAGACLGGMAPRSRAQWRWIGTTVGFGSGCSPACSWCGRVRRARCLPLRAQPVSAAAHVEAEDRESFLLGESNLPFGSILDPAAAWQIDQPHHVLTERHVV